MALFTNATHGRCCLLSADLPVELLDRRKRAASAICFSVQDPADSGLSNPKQRGQGGLP